MDRATEVRIMEAEGGYDCECGGVDDGTGCCESCGASLEECTACGGVGHHKRGCEALEEWP